MNNELKKTIFLDIDGCIFKHQGNMSTQYKEPIVLPGVIEKINEWDRNEYKIILVTGRRECMRKITEEQLLKYGIFYDQLVMGINRGERIIINDMKPGRNINMASAINIVRNEGLINVNV